ncbi:ferrochelatase [Actinomycetospora endophytica]|uniref:Coproporphyrin III ferrochelatase n=1 Tax=Actinomycetospora endophytica TaxID=2291215 RepID=A0ABS8PA87_9PSEU|nr:ferrochelatase [Actinomycetospora endophytica]MCD2195034.1 ferrochelatase [Actinomycetospora endophytica]
MSTNPVDAVLVLSFGGPEAPDEVRPFLENVVRGRNVPPERLDEVEEHYHHFGGMSPINGLNREMIAALRRELDAAGYDLPVYFGNRNWHPFAEDTVTEMAQDGVRNALVFATSAYGGYSACRQYHEDIARARAAAIERLGDEALVPDLTKLRHFYDHPLFVASVADGVRAARETLDEGHDARLVFTAHSIPVSADETAGPPEEGGHRYSRQVGEAARLVAGEVGVGDYDQVWQSRSGPPQIPWLDPQIEDHVEALAGKGVTDVVVSPVGFVSDHVEVAFDLDTELAEQAGELGVRMARAASAGSDPRFIRMIVELIAEQVSGAEPRACGTGPRGGVGCNGTLCAPGCCEPPARRRPST